MASLAEPANHDSPVQEYTCDDYRFEGLNYDGKRPCSNCNSYKSGK